MIGLLAIGATEFRDRRERKRARRKRSRVRRRATRSSKGRTLVDEGDTRRPGMEIALTGDARRLPLTHRPATPVESRGGDTARPGGEGGMPQLQAAAGQEQPAPGRLGGEEVPQSGARLRGPDPGGQRRPGEGHREVRPRHKGYRFSTYSTWWIRQAVQRASPTTDGR